ncbi:unnamed protein product [Strongylus vulgaris]|uniref:Saposin B-type domain-containing protein n=1 Tax=Strongylus vulgaris TaxID=40348 RepID=A0A3P7KYU5_STRVU|nr:unnamed protein product [Strongylus vulgaris]
MHTDLQDAVKLCKMVIKHEMWMKKCVMLMKDILGAVYKQLRQFEPKPELCAHLRLCDSCELNVTSSLMDIAARSPDADPVVLIGQLSQMQATLTQFATMEVNNRDMRTP